MRRETFTRYDPDYILGLEIHGSTLGILGIGRVGTQISRRARGFNMCIIYYNRQRRENLEEEVSVVYVSFQELLSTADHVMVCVSLTETTINMIGAK